MTYTNEEMNNNYLSRVLPYASGSYVTVREHDCCEDGRCPGCLDEYNNDEYYKDVMCCRNKRHKIKRSYKIHSKRWLKKSERPTNQNRHGNMRNKKK